MAEEQPDDVALPDPEEESEELGAAGKAAIAKERKRAKAAESRLKSLESALDGLKPEDLKRLQETQQREAELRAEYDARVEDEKAKAIAETKQQLEIKDKKFLDAVGERNSLLQTQLLSNAFQVAGGRSGGGEDGSTYFDALMGAIGSSFKLNDEGSVVVLDGKGEARLTEDGDPMEPAAYLESLKAHPVYGHFFNPKSSGHGGGMRGQGNLTSGSAKGMTALEKLQYGLGGN